MPAGVPHPNNQRPGLGTHRCIGTSSAGTACVNFEVEGLEFCVQHMPDDDLEEAEEITGVYRCRTRFGQPDACHAYAVADTEPPTCTKHGANAGGRMSQGTAKRVIENNMTDRLAQIMAEGGEKLMQPDDIANPLDELLSLAAEMKALKEALRNITSYLYSKDRLRYAHSKVGEQLRMEVLLYERALERFAKILIDISKLKIEDRLAGVREQTAAMLERALDAALEDSGVGIEGKQQAKATFQRHLKVVA